MKNKFFILVALMLLATMVFPVPAYAWNGVNGDVIDSRELDPWVYGGEIWIVNNTEGTIIGTGYLNTTDDPGHFDLAFGVDDIACDCVDLTGLSSSDSLEVFILPYAGPNGTPGTLSRAFTYNSIPARYQVGYLQTGTGPTALELVNFSVAPQSSGNTWLPFVLLVGSVALVSGTVTLIRKRRA